MSVFAPFQANALGELIAEYYEEMSSGAQLLRVVIAAGALPVSKRLIGVPVVGTASDITNALSAIGLKYFPNLKIGRQVLGTNRVFGLAGRLNLVAGVGFLSYDVTSIVLSVPLSGDLTLGDRINEVILDPFFPEPP
jgi:hypothetical protein